MINVAIKSAHVRILLKYCNQFPCLTWGWLQIVSKQSRYLTNRSTAFRPRCTHERIRTHRVLKSQWGGRVSAVKDVLSQWKGACMGWVLRNGPIWEERTMSRYAGDNVDCQLLPICCGAKVISFRSIRKISRILERKKFWDCC